MKRVSTRQYELSHGKAPRGRGRWALEASAWLPCGTYRTETVWHTGTLTEAVRVALKAAKALGGDYAVEVLP